MEHCGLGSPAGEAASDFADAGIPASAPKKQEQKVRFAKTKIGKTLSILHFSSSGDFGYFSAGGGH